MKNRQKYYMTIQPTLYGVLRLGLLRTDTRTETQPENLKRIRAGDYTAGNTGHGFFNRFFSSETIQHGTKAGDLAPIRKGTAARQRKC